MSRFLDVLGTQKWLKKAGHIPDFAMSLDSFPSARRVSIHGQRVHGYFWPELLDWVRTHDVDGDQCELRELHPSLETCPKLTITSTRAPSKKSRLKTGEIAPGVRPLHLCQTPAEITANKAFHKQRKSAAHR